MWIVTLTVPAAESDLLLAELSELAIAGVTEKERGGSVELQVFFDDEAAALECAGRFGSLQPTVSVAEERDWVAAFREGWDPVLLGERIFLLPDWRDDPTPVGRIRIPSHPGMACGSGAHPCTQMCLIALERYLRPGGTVVDVGTGSGLLSVASVRLGAGPVIACDIDPDAVGVAQENAGIDGASASFFVGSGDAVRTSRADLLMANISPEVNIALAPDWKRILKPDGVAILSGFELVEKADVRAAVAATGLEFVEEMIDSGWVCQVWRQVS